MNEFTTKKLAEVQAFLNTGTYIIQHAGDAFTDKAPMVSDLLEQLASSDIESFISEASLDLFKTKTEKTTNKLQKMMELYIGDEWDNPVEVLEWCSFYAGAGAAHSALASSATETESSDLSAQLAGYVQSYRTMLDEVMDCLRAFAQTRSRD